MRKSPGVRTRQAERSSSYLERNSWVGMALSADWLRPWRWTRIYHSEAVSYNRRSAVATRASTSATRNAGPMVIAGQINSDRTSRVGGDVET